MGRVIKVARYEALRGRHTLDTPPAKAMVILATLLSIRKIKKVEGS